MIPKTAKDIALGYLYLALMYTTMLIGIPLIVGLESVAELWAFIKLSATVFAQLLALAGINALLAAAVWQIGKLRRFTRDAVALTASSLAVLTGLAVARALWAWHQGQVPEFAKLMPFFGLAVFCVYAVQAAGVVRLTMHSNNVNHGNQ